MLLRGFRPAGRHGAWQLLSTRCRACGRPRSRQVEHRPAWRGSGIPSGKFALANSAPDVTIDARYNDWSDPSGPSGGVEDPVTHATADGSGSAISGSIRFDPWTGKGIIWGPGNIDIDPLFANPGHWNDGTWVQGDYHLKSEQGRWDPASESWVADDVTSPCIDAGDPADGYANEPEPNGARINMGAYGNTAQASKTPNGPLMHTITLLSEPVEGVDIISGTQGAPAVQSLLTTNCTAVHARNDTVRLTAPAAVTVSDRQLRFVRWSAGDQPQAICQTYLTATMTGDRTFTAEYRLIGDANGDCKVNVLDLIFIRNRLNSNPATGDDWQADVNADGKINVLDLIYVRNRLNTQCQ